MNFFSWKILRAELRPGLFLGWCLLALAFPVYSQTNIITAPRTNHSSPERFLIIIEASSDMEKRALNVQRSVGLLLSRTLREELQRGDTIGLWTYDQELHTGKFPLQRWLPTAGKEIILATVQFVQQMHYARQARLDPVMAQLKSLVADSDKLTVILISSGNEAPTGTPFDEQIAEVFKLNVSEQRKQAMPFVTILRSLHGKFVGFKVNTPPWPFEVPAYPVQAETVLPTPAPTNATTPAKAEAAPRPPAAKPIIILQPASAPAERTNTLLPASSPPAPSVVKSPPTEAPPNPPAVAAVTPPPVEMPIAPPPVERTSSPPAQPPSPVPSPATVAPVQPAMKTPVVPILIGAGVVVLGISLWCFLLVKRAREQPRVSLISRSMNRDGK
jgi:hypothetical protein